MYMLYWNQTKCPIHKVWWRREAAQIGQTFIPRCEKVFKTQRGRIPINPAILAVIEHRFISKQNKNLIIPTRGSEATRAETRNPETFCLALYHLIVLVGVCKITVNLYDYRT